MRTDAFVSSNARIVIAPGKVPIAGPMPDKSVPTAKENMYTRINKQNFKSLKKTTSIRIKIIHRTNVKSVENWEDHATVVDMNMTVYPSKLYSYLVLTNLDMI